jgi:hypothetical protein
MRFRGCGSAALTSAPFEGRIASELAAKASSNLLAVRRDKHGSMADP